MIETLVRTTYIERQNYNRKRNSNNDKPLLKLNCYSIVNIDNITVNFTEMANHGTA